MSTHHTTQHPPLPSAREPLWLCLHFARLALDIFAQPDDARAIAVIERRRVHCANRNNLPAGLAIATAHALHPDLLALERRPEREHDALHRLAHWAYQFTPGIAIAAHNSLLLEIGSCRLLYRSLRRLLQKIRRSLRQRHQYADLGLAHTPKAAWLLAQCRSTPALCGDTVDDALLLTQLARVPVTALEIDNESQRALKQMGLTTLEALRDLPAAALSKRFGAVFTDYLQKVSGDQADPQTLFIPAPQFQHSLTFIDGIAQRQMLLFPMKRLLQALEDYLRARQLHCHTLLWKLFDAHRVQAEFSIELSRTHNRWHDLLELSRLKLEQVLLSEHVFSINLSCEDFFEAAPTAQQLFPDANDQREAAAALIDRLQARLGKNVLQGITTQKSHWPELAWRYSAIYGSNAIRSTPNTDLHPLWLRPLWLLPHPQPLPQHNSAPHWPTPLTLLRGPERIGNHWWQAKESERDYYIARNEHGVTCWIYRDHSTQRWFLHGLFA